MRCSTCSSNASTTGSIRSIAPISTPAWKSFSAELREEAGRRGRKIRVHTKYVPDLDSLATLTRHDVEKIIDRSLHRLRVRRLDLVQFHWWDFSVPGWIEAAEHLEALRRAGKIRHLGVTNFDVDHLRSILDAGVEIVSNQVQYSLLDRRPERAMVDFCTEARPALALLRRRRRRLPRSSVARRR